MFRVVLQKNEFVLRGLIGSLLHLDPDDIKSIRITNPIKLGEQIDNKTFILDIEIELNDDTLLNLEMQVVNPGNWPDRSLSYLCRSYDQLFHGEDYNL
jgi:predicted transposase/invertase (TIGR01784 family)